MNILPKKSWHVRTKANIERVRRDEVKAAEEEKDKQTRIAIAEQEARTTLLRHRAEQRALAAGQEPTPSSSAVEIATSGNNEKQVQVFKEGQHINFWSEFEEGKTTTGTNAEYEKEKKDEKEKQEQAIGLLTYLGQSSSERLTNKPWYQLPGEKRTLVQEEACKPSTKKKDEERDKKKKHANDPMKMMGEYLEKKRKNDEKHNPKDEHWKHKHKRKAHSSESKKRGGSKSIEELRAERHRREKAEQVRTEELLAKLRGEKPAPKPEEELDDRKRGYNSQFNPELVRKPKSKHSGYSNSYH